MRSLPTCLFLVKDLRSFLVDVEFGAGRAVNELLDQANLRKRIDVVCWELWHKMEDQDVFATEDSSFDRLGLQRRLLMPHKVNITIF